MRVPVTEMYELLSMIYRRMDDVSRRQVRRRFNTIDTVDQTVSHLEAAEYLTLSNIIRGPAPDHERCSCGLAHTCLCAVTITKVFDTSVKRSVEYHLN